MILKRKISLALETRQQQHIENEIITDPPDDGLKLQCEALKKLFPSELHRPVQPGQTYNCHGLAFAARRTRIWKPSEIAKIITQDGYKPIKRSEVLPGDVAVYYVAGDAEHSGIVISPEEPPTLPRILSKVGNCHEMVHFAQNCSYDATDIRYYRIVS